MKLFFKLLIKDTLLFTVSSVIILLSAFVTLSQVGLYTNFYSAINQIDKNVSEDISEDTINQNLKENPQKKTIKKTIEKTIREKSTETKSESSRIDGLKKSFKNFSLPEKIRTVYRVWKRSGRDRAFELILSQKDNGFILIFGLAGLSLILLVQFFLFVKNTLLELLGIRLSNKLRKKTFSSLIFLPVPFFKKNKSGDIVTTIINDLNLIKLHTFNLLDTIFFAFTLVISAFVIMFMTNAVFTLIIIGFGIVAALVMNVVSRLLNRVLHALRQNLSDIGESISNMVYGIDMVKIFNREHYEITRFDDHSDNYARKTFHERLLTQLIRPLTETLGAFAVIGILLFGANQMWSGELLMEEIIRYIVLLLVISPHFKKAANVIKFWNELSVSMKRLKKYINEEPEKHSVGRRRIENFTGGVTFDQVSFSYDDKDHENEDGYVLDNISFKVKPGEMIGFVGPSGCGKSTLINLIAAFINPSKGKIFFDQTDLSEVGVDDIRDQIALVSQETILFPATIYENLRYGNLNASRHEIETAAESASIHDFIISMPHGYDTVVGERGLNLSGGQRQRLGIARAILKQPKILLLDEATSALDSHAEKRVQTAVENLVSKQTIFVVAHRLSTLKKAHRIFVLKDGRVNDQGTYDELLQKNPEFQELHNMQRV